MISKSTVNKELQGKHIGDLIQYDMIEEFNVDSKAEYTAQSSIKRYARVRYVWPILRRL